MEYIQQGILKENPFASINPNGVGMLIDIGVRVDVPPSLTLKLASAGNMADIQRASRSAINLD